jgi:hypothetical protein
MFTGELAMLWSGSMLREVVMLVVATSLISAATSSTIHQAKETIINSRVMPANLLPQFLFAQGKVETGTIVAIGGGRGTKITTTPDVRHCWLLLYRNSRHF